MTESLRELVSFCAVSVIDLSSLQFILLPWQLAEDCHVFVVAVTRRRDDVNSSLTVSTRISIELEMSVPNAAHRRSVCLPLLSTISQLSMSTCHVCLDNEFVIGLLFRPAAIIIIIIIIIIMMSIFTVLLSWLPRPLQELVACSEHIYFPELPEFQNEDTC